MFQLNLSLYWIIRTQCKIHVFPLPNINNRTSSLHNLLLQQYMQPFPHQTSTTNTLILTCLPKNVDSFHLKDFDQGVNGLDIKGDKALTKYDKNPKGFPACFGSLTKTVKSTSVTFVDKHTNNIFLNS